VCESEKLRSLTVAARLEGRRRRPSSTRGSPSVARSGDAARWRARATVPAARQCGFAAEARHGAWPRLQRRLLKTGGRLVKHARYYWLTLAESHLTRRLFGSMVRRIGALAVATG
jgi:hypothetical protein